MTRKLLALAALVTLWLPTTMIGQKELKKANKQFELKAFELAIDNYKVALQKEPGNIECIYKIAESYRLTNQPIDAIGWYRKIEKLGDVKPEYILNYAHTLKAVGKYRDAQNLYWKYQSTDPVVGEHFAQSCDFAAELLGQEENYEISLFGANTRYADFGVSFLNGKTIFNTFAYKSAVEIERGDSDIHKAGNKLVYALDYKPKYQDNIMLLRGENKEKEFVGPISYDQSGAKVAFTKNNFVNGHRYVTDMDVDLSIFLAEVEFNGDFKNDVAFPHNELGYSTGFPSLAFNGSALYFASNRPGGFGGYDLYVSYLKNGKWSSPENLGESINTAGNEITPHFDGEKLYFSSDFHHGLGGFDIFESVVENGAWSYPENMGKIINSPSDDYFFVVNKETNDYYFTSNRIGGRGQDDIYIATPKQKDLLAVNENAFVPKAVSLTDMVEPNNTNPLVETVSLKTEEVNMSEVPAAIDLDKILADKKSEEFSLADAKRVALGEVISAREIVYFVQLAAYSKHVNDIYRFKHLVKFGNIYKIYKPNSTKIRVGYYLDQTEAREVLSQIRRLGFADAFITKETLNTAEMELVYSSFEDAGSPNTNYEDSMASVNNGKYKVKLASYEDPIWFDISKVKDMGNIEQWTKGSWTIFVLSGYANLAEAQAAKRAAINRGFSDAYVVIDKGGILEKLVEN